VSADLEHRKCMESLGAYALGALPDGEAERVRQHLDGCRECRAELEWLRAAVDALPASVPPIEPPPELKARVMEIVESEAELLRAAGEPADRPPPPSPTPRRRWFSIGALAPAVALAAVCVVALVVMLVVSGGGSGIRVINAQIVDPALAGRVHASLRVQGTEAQLRVSGLPAPPADHVDQLWVQHSTGAPPRSAGTFVVQSGSVSLSRPVRRGDLVLVSVEPGRGSAAPTTAPLLVARA